MKKEYLIGLVVLVAAALAAAYFFYRPNEPVAPPDNTATTTNISGGGYTIERLPLNDIMSAAPSLTRAVIFSASVPPDARTQLQKSIADIQVKLKIDSTQVADWLQLGLLYHTANDYEGAKEVWEFLVQAIPEDTTAYENLGKLYHFSLKDYPKAEEYFLKSIAIVPNSPAPYYELFTLYRYSYKKDTNAAVDILKKLAAVVPADYGPWLQLGTYYRDLGQTTDARSAFTTAMDKARALGDIDAMQRIGDELQKLPQ